ncbi:MAG: site-specific integrase, partial [Tannerellaceae bacterium]
MLTDSFLKYLRYERNYSSCTLDAYRRDLNQFEAYLRDESVFFDPK